MLGATPAVLCLHIWLRWGGPTTSSGHKHLLGHTSGAEPGHSRVCGGKRPKSLTDVNAGFKILSLGRELWLKASVGKKPQRLRWTGNSQVQTAA